MTTRVTLNFSRPGIIQRQRSRLMFDRQLVLLLADAKEKNQLFREEYNGFRPHSAWSSLTLKEVVQQHSNGPIFYFRPTAKFGRSSLR